MKLQRLELQGYKSFADRTEFLFPTGITAIVGPNGSGKSNIADAIRWALGEQSLRLLRGKTTEDMIYSGGGRRPRAGMVQVLLTLDNGDNWLPLEFSEVTLGRRAYRSGESEYLLNGDAGRLKDIRELFFDTGLGADAHSIMEQGKIDALLQANRQFLDNSVGIHVQLVVFLQLLQRRAGRIRALAEKRATFGTEHQVFEHGEVLDQHEMLVHHPDPGTDGGLTVLDRDRLAVDLDGSLIGLIEAVEDRHQRRLAGAVFTDDAVDRALGDRQIDILVGMHRTELLVDADQFDRGCLARCIHSGPPDIQKGRRTTMEPSCARILDHFGQELSDM